MLGDNYVGMIMDVDENGYYVDVFRNGQTVRYGPMHYVSSSGDDVQYYTGDRVFITTLFFRDQYVILGRYIDMHPKPLDADDSDAGAMIDLTAPTE